MSLSDTRATKAAAAPGWAAALFKAGLEPAGAGTDGVWAIAGDAPQATISDQFKAHAGDYHQRYAASDHFEHLFRDAIAATGLAAPASPVILDLGSGSGVNSVVPCLRLFPQARIVATDLSAELLAILAAHLRQTGQDDRVACVVMDAMGREVNHGAFDLVVGASILHHLTLPERAINGAALALKPGGAAIFLEPFDGYGLMRLAYQRILAEAELRRVELDPAIARALRVMVGDIAARTAPDRTAPSFAAMDDKWLFSRHRIEVVARDGGFCATQFVPHNDHPSLYRDLALIQLRLAAKMEAPALPDWALAILDEFDAAMPAPAKRQLMTEATIVLTRGG